LINRRAPDINALEKLLNFLFELGVYKISHRLTSVRPEAVMVDNAVPGERWEVEFFADGHVEAEVFKSPGIIGGEEILARLFEEFSD
jgi:hypothetical protein